MDTEAAFLSTKDAADEIGVGTDRFRQMEREGKIPAIRTRGGVRLFRLSDVLSLKMKRARTREKAAHGR